jgi:3-dehydroquinate dehydratase-1
MRIVAALTDPADAARAQEQGADMVELRFDLMEGDPVAIAELATRDCTLPVIATFRSVQEGGRYAGSPDEWLGRITPVLPLADFVDMEQRFSLHAGAIRAAGKPVIASYHTGGMPGMYELFDLERFMRTYGDIVKIIVTPQNEEDIIELISFTHAVKQPVCTGVMGSQYRYARALLPLFGSELAYCSVGEQTAAGQYTVAEFRELMGLLGTS